MFTLLLFKVTVIGLAFIELGAVLGNAIWFNERELLRQIKESSWMEIILIIIPAFFLRSFVRVIARIMKKAVLILVDWIVYQILVSISIDADYVVIDDKNGGRKNG